MSLSPCVWLSSHARLEFFATDQRVGIAGTTFSDEPFSEKAVKDQGWDGSSAPLSAPNIASTGAA